MNPSTDLVTIAFARQEAGSPEFAAGRATGIRLTGPEAACHWMAIVKAVNALPEVPKAWAYYAYVDGDDKRWQVGRIVPHVFRALEWVDPKAWEGDMDKKAQKIAAIKFEIQAIHRRGVLDSEFARAVGQKDGSGVASRRPWGQYRAAIKRVFGAWDADILDAVAYALESKAA